LVIASILPYNPLDIEAFDFVEEFLFDQNFPKFPFRFPVPNGCSFEELLHGDVPVVVGDQCEQKVFIARWVHFASDLNRCFPEKVLP